jgi:glycosyltransferase involved in cell wall biosynthesis
MRVLHFINRLGAGGAERLLITLIKEQLKAGFDVSWCAFGNGERANADKLPTKPILLDYNFSRRNAIKRRKAKLAIRKLCDSINPDVIHSHLWPSANLVEETIERTRIPHAVHVQDTLPWLWTSDWRSKWMRWRTKSLFKKKENRSIFLTVSQATLDKTASALKLELSRFRLVHNVVDPEIHEILKSEAFQSARNRYKSTKIRIGILGRIEANKGHELLLNAISMLKMKGYPVQCRIVGSGSTCDTLKANLSALQLCPDEDALFLGHRDDVVQELAQFDIFTLPSTDSEGLSLSQLEAMAAGLPCVVTDVAGAKEAIRNDLDGLVIPCGSSKSLADALERLLQSPDLMKALGQSAQRRVADKFSVQKLVNQVNDAYRTICAKR